MILWEEPGDLCLSLPNIQKPNEYVLHAGNAYHKKIARRLIRAMQKPRPGFNLTFMSLMTDFARFMRCCQNSSSLPGNGQNWMADFFKWALWGRARAFVRFARETPHPHRKKILYVLHKLATRHWPWNAAVGGWFLGTWGWYQKEIYGWARLQWRHGRNRTWRREAPSGLITLPKDLYHRTRFTFDPDKPNYGFRHVRN